MRSALICAFVVLGCSGPVDDDPSQWAGVGGATSSGGDFSATGGETSSPGGSGGLETSTGGALVTGGASSGGATGGSETGGASSGGAPTGGSSTGGTSSGGESSGGSGSTSSGGGSTHYTTSAAPCINGGTRFESVDACLFIYRPDAGYQTRLNEATGTACASVGTGKGVNVSPGDAAQVSEGFEVVAYAPNELGECGIVCGEEKGVERKCVIPEGRAILGGSVDWEGEPRCFEQTVPPGPVTACTW
jgi:hypothetical protein